MSAPQDLVFVRHGQSEANAMRTIGENGDESVFTDEVMTVPDNSWRLTEKGVKQAEAVGAYLRKTFGTFDRHVNSPFIRTRETAARMNLNHAFWRENRMIRERSWGEIDSMSKSRFKKEYPHNYLLMKKDPIYWTPPAGESLAEVAENRASNFLRSLSRDASGAKVIAVSHGEFIAASRMIIEEWPDDIFYESESPVEKIPNCAIVHYTRRNPKNGKLADRMSWVRISQPELIVNTETGEEEWGVTHQEDWRFFERRLLTNSDLLQHIENQAHHFTQEQMEQAN